MADKTKTTTRRRGQACRIERAPGGEPRTRRVTVRVSPSEEKRYTAQARKEAAPGCKHGASLSGWLRTAAEARTRGDVPAVPGAPAPAAEGYVGQRCGTLYTPQGAEGACYGIRRASELITSHNPRTWEPDTRYPRAVQERDYRADKNEQMKVQRIAQGIKPELLLTNTPTAVDGPPVVSGRSIVLGGNGRAMGVRLAYETGAAEPYRLELLERAPAFGLTREDVEAVADPILVRVVRGLDDATQPELAAASSRYNEGLTNGLDERARAVSLSRRLSPRTLEAIGDQLDKWETLRKAMEEAGRKFVERLEADGLVTAQNRAAMVAESGGLTELGKLTVEGAFLGLVVGEADRLRQAAPSTLQKVERLVPFFARVRARDNGHDLTPTLQAAMDLVYQARVADRPVSVYAGQGALFGEEPRPSEVVEFAELLERQTSKRLASAARKWAAAADYDPNQPSFFGHPTPEKTRAAFFDHAREA